MVLKKIDRYVSWAFLSRFLGAVCLLGVLYITFDLLKRLEEIQQAGLSDALRTVATYYGYLMALFLADIVPGLVLVSAGMIVVSMVKRRELLALKASGTSVYRTVAPIFFWTVVISVVAFGFRETIGPRFARRKEVLNRVLDNDVERELLLRDDRFDRKVFVGQYNFPKMTMKDVCVLEFYPQAALSLRRMVQADTANWLPDGRLQLETVEVRPFEPSGAVGRKEFLPTMTLETDLTAFDFVRAAEEEGDTFTLMRTLPELHRLIRTQPEIPHFQVLFHSRIASFFSPFILLLIGLPCLIGFEHSIKSRFLSVIISILVAAGYYALSFVFTSMGETQAVPAIAAGWLPSIAAGSTGLWLFQAVLT